MRRTIKQVIIDALSFSFIILLYTAFFQTMYCWMTYGTITGDFNVVELLYSLLVNYIPILVLSFGIMAVARWTLCINNPVRKIVIDIAVSLIILIAVNFSFKFITGLSLNWGGSVFNGVIILLGVEFWLLSQQKQKTLIRENILTKENMSMHYEIQKAHVNPHFLYNTLDMLSALIEDDMKDEALEFIVRLSAYYRSMNRRLNMHLTTLSEEMSMVNNYLEIVRYKHGDALKFHIEDTSDSDPTIVPFSIQLLVENVLKHNSISLKHPISIVVSVSDTSITVYNNCNPKVGASHKGYGIGLTYLKKIYAYHDKTIEITETPDRFTVTLPTLIRDSAT